MPINMQSGRLSSFHNWSEISQETREREREQLLHCERFFSLIDWYTKGEGLSTKRKRTCLEISESYSIQSWFSRQFPSRLPSLSELITLANSFFLLVPLSRSRRNFTNLSQMICSFVYQFSSSSQTARTDQHTRNCNCFGRFLWTLSQIRLICSD